MNSGLPDTNAVALSRVSGLRRILEFPHTLLDATDRSLARSLASNRTIENDRDSSWGASTALTDRINTT